MLPLALRAAEPCPFDHQRLVYSGSALEQARCLLRHVRPYGELDPPTDALPAPLPALIGTPPGISTAALRNYLAAHDIAEAQLGGALDAPVSHAMAGDPRAPLAHYFVIHDTSTPALGTAPFPDDIDQPTWPHNDLGVWLQGANSRAHVFISRTGGSVTPVDFSEPWRATKFEMQDTLLRRKGLFLHIELVSPRRSDPAGPQPNDALAPPGGFPVVQYDRLALVYVAASLRRGEWLIPAFHAVLDAGRVDGHDDPQNFNLDAFANSLTRLIDAIVNTPAAGAKQSPVASTRIPE